MFDDIIGHKENIKTLSEMINQNKVLNSYLFVGRHGIGKKLVAIDFAKAILKVDILESSMDYKYIEKKADKKDITVEQIRKYIVDDVYIKPSQNQKKVYIINDAQFLNEEAQNTLLKTLEETPFYVVIILIADSVKNFLPTVLSRLFVMNFKTLDSAQVLMYVKEKYNKSLNADLLEYIDGSIGITDDIFLNNMQLEFEKINQLYDFLEKKDTVNAAMYSANIDFKNSEFLDYLEFLMYKNFKYNCVDIVENAKKRLKNNGNYDIVINTMLIKIVDQI